MAIISAIGSNSISSRRSSSGSVGIIGGGGVVVVNCIVKRETRFDHGLETIDE